MRIAATSMTPIQVIESFRAKLQSIGISSFMQVNFESTNSKVICESESDACPQRASESGKRLRRVTGGAPSARRRLWRLANTKRCCSSERLRIGRKGESSGLDVTDRIKKRRRPTSPDTGFWRGTVKASIKRAWR